MLETLRYCIEYLQCFQGMRCRVWDDKKEQIMNDEVVQGSSWAREISLQLLEWTHNFVLSNSTDLEEWRQCVSFLFL